MSHPDRVRVVVAGGERYDTMLLEFLEILRLLEILEMLEMLRLLGY